MKKIEKRLFAIFDYQRFNKDSGLQSFIDDAQRSYETSPELADADLSFAIGGRKQEEQKKDPADEDR